ncbi:hypothetical protein [uncultured Devosia sp.]|uniref:hypothetical protein n=1 Tax=uncultured Devosia sp. TaxID=211434 RepID=UPI0035CBD141
MDACSTSLALMPQRRRTLRQIVNGRSMAGRTTLVARGGVTGGIDEDQRRALPPGGKPA